MKPDSFWDSVNILLTKPHVINKRLWGSKTWIKFIGKPNSSVWNLPAVCNRLEENISVQNIEDVASNIANELNIVKCISSGEDLVEVIIIELLPRTYTDHQAYQLVCLAKNQYVATFYNITPKLFEQNLCPEFSYKISFDKGNITLSAQSECGSGSKSYVWLVNTLLPQLVKWGTESKATPNLCNESLSLVSKTKYYDKYNKLKDIYGKEMVKIWPECTDPSKFVYEDVAIAAYLLLLWETIDNSKTKTFVDLGCGNGLLVYILTMEGHTGLGLDVRKRNIWDMYPKNVKLEEKTITPSDTSMFPTADWIIGNHSDELTPWIPVIAANSSYKCNFFLLPCCSYNFDGSKYQRKNSHKSQYTDYLEYIKQLCIECGFKTETDRLKIPSTKRICLVSHGRSYAETDYEHYCQKIDEIIRTDTRAICNQTVEDSFKAREPVERVRNCTQIDKSVIDSIVRCITSYLLENCNQSDTKWCIGRSAKISDLVALIPKHQLDILKSECGGLQTLIKNNHHIFKVQSGEVELRYPRTVSEININTVRRQRGTETIKVQQKPCWFFNNHPQGCPLTATNCSFLHLKKIKT